MLIDTPSILQAAKPDEIKKTAKSKTGKGKTAIIICHGMGQQVKFQTLSTLANILLKKSGSSGITPDKVELVKFEGKILPRVTMNLKNKDEEKEVHLYETYWAPLTEGRVTLRDVIRFLFSAGWRGIKFSLFKKFRMWMFGKMQTLKFPKLSTSIQLSVVLILLLAILIFSLLAAFLFCARLANELTILWGLAASESAFKAISSYYNHLSTVIGVRHFLYLLIYVIIIWLLVKLKNLLIEYPGDVAAYVSSYKLNKFYEIRDQIKDKAAQVAKAVYYSVEPDSNEFLYDSIIVMGHSLGSVIAYDMLNGVINEDLMLNHSYDAVNRTKLLLTFGSPLNKTAFLFRTQIKDEQYTREILAASMQPLICSYVYRPEKWINIWSHMDIISGSLSFYDEPDTKNPLRVENIIDWKSWIPFAAHNQYWKNDKIPEILYNAIFQSSTILKNQ